mmetsp:Transcript_22514/g.66151  ORF Transcript_22514/g.66151 Transcript_22514/m.66151 type:complete len:569 (-) Transcript_22514:451-2157(-)
MLARLDGPVEAAPLVRDGEEAVRGEVDPVEPRRQRELRQRRARPELVPHRLEPLEDLAARVERRHAVQVGRGGSGGRDRVRNLVGGALGDVAGGERHAERLGRHLAHLCVQALPHLGAAVRDEHRAVCVDVHERAALVHELCGEVDAELGGQHGDAALAPAVRRVEGGRRLAPRLHLGALAQLSPRTRHAPLAGAEHLPERERVALGVHVRLAERVGRHAQLRREVLQDVLARDEALRAAKAAEGRVRRRVGAADDATRAEGGPAVAVVEVEEGAVHHGAGEVEEGAAVRVELRLEGGELGHALAVPPRRRRVLDHERVPPARGAHVDVAPQREADGCVHLVGGRRARRRHEGGPRLLAAEAAPHPANLGDHLGGGQVEQPGDRLVRLVDALSRGEDRDAAVVCRLGEARHRLEVKVLLPAHAELARHDGQPLLGERLVDVAARLQVVRRRDAERGAGPRPRRALVAARAVEEGSRRHRGIDGVDGGLPRVAVLDGDRLRRRASRLDRVGHRHADHLPHVRGVPVREALLILGDRTERILPAGREVGGEDDVRHARHRARSRGVDAQD